MESCQQGCRGGGLACLLARATLLVMLSLGVSVAAEPLSSEQVIQVLTSGGLSSEELSAIIASRGVDFVLDSQTSSQLLAAGATEAVLGAIRNGAPSEAAGSPPPPASGPPLSINQLRIALETGADQGLLQQMVTHRGISFAFKPEIGRGLKDAGAGSELLAAIALANFVEAAPASGVTSAEALPEDFVPLPIARAKDFDPFARQGRLDLRMFIDGATEVRIQGGRIIHKNLNARVGRNAGTEFTQPLPAKELKSLATTKKEGRGQWVVLQQPSAGNGYELVLRIYDEKGGEDRYHIEIQWESAE